MDQWMGYGNTYVPQAQNGSQYIAPVANRFDASNPGVNSSDPSSFLSGGGGIGSFAPSTTFSGTYGQYPGVNSNPYPSAASNGGGYGISSVTQDPSMVGTYNGGGNPSLANMQYLNWGNINPTLGMGGPNGFAGNLGLFTPGSNNYNYVAGQDQNFFNNTNWANQSQAFGRVFDQWNLMNQQNPNQFQNFQNFGGPSTGLMGGYDFNPADSQQQLQTDYVNQYNYFQNQGAFGTPTSGGNLPLPGASSGGNR